VALRAAVQFGQLVATHVEVMTASFRSICPSEWRGWRVSHDVGESNMGTGRTSGPATLDRTQAPLCRHAAIFRHKKVSLQHLQPRRTLCLPLNNITYCGMTAGGGVVKRQQTPITRYRVAFPWIPLHIPMVTHRHNNKRNGDFYSVSLEALQKGPMEKKSPAWRQVTIPAP
jgi:hypothetical protein